MFATITRTIKRFIILVPGILIGYLAYTDLFPAFNRRLNGALALLFTYILAAYVLIPLGLRFVRVFVRHKHLPLYSTTPDGLASDPLNIGIVGTKEQLIDAMQKAGWHQADERTIRTMLRFQWRYLVRRPYPTAPFSNLYLFGRKQDIGFQLPIGNDVSNRHHVRFWAASHTGNPRHLDHINFWRTIHSPDPVHERILWVGAASLDNGLGIIRHNAQITHMIHPDTNAERDFIVRDLQKTNLVKKTHTEKIGDPYRLTNRVLTGYLRADGRMTICELKKS